MASWILAAVTLAQAAPKGPNDGIKAIYAMVRANADIQVPLAINPVRSVTRKEKLQNPMAAASKVAISNGGVIVAAGQKPAVASMCRTSCVRTAIPSEIQIK